jgi:hypothetical protein
MLSKEFIFEAESNIKVKKYLDLLSDTDIENVLKMLQMNEQGEQFSYKDFIKSTAATPQKNKSTSSATPKTKSSKLPKVKKSNNNKQDIDDVIKNLSKKDKESLASTLKKEKQKRATKQKPAAKVVQPKKSSGFLGKIIVGLAIAIGALSAMPDDPKTSDQTTASQQQDGKYYSMFQNAPYKIASMIKNTAFDEDSLKFKNWKVHLINDKESNTAWGLISGEVNGKNKFGAYVGYKSFVASIDFDSGEIQKLYMEDDPKYMQVMALMKSYGNDVKTGPAIGPN